MFKAKESRLVHWLVKQHDGTIESPPWWHTQRVHLLGSKPNVDQRHRNFTSPNSHRLGDNSRTVQKETLERLLLWNLSWLHRGHARLAGASFVPFSVVKNGAPIRASHSGAWNISITKGSLVLLGWIDWPRGFLVGWTKLSWYTKFKVFIHFFFLLFFVFLKMVLFSVSKFISDLCLYKFF